MSVFIRIRNNHKSFFSLLSSKSNNNCRINNVLVVAIKDFIVCSNTRSYSSTANNNKINYNLLQKTSSSNTTSSNNRFFSFNNSLLNNNNIKMSTKKKVAIIGSGNWGSAIAKITGKNVTTRSNIFDPEIKMYVYEEQIDGKKLTEIINTTHENVKYLPGIKLPENIIADPDVVNTTKDADILVFVLPHQFVKGICKSIKGKIKHDAIAISLIKGFDTGESGIKLISDIISDNLSIECAVLMGANLAHEVANEDFCESTIGVKTRETGMMLKQVFDAEYFRCSVVSDTKTVEACGALKNIVAVGSGIVEGLNKGDNTKAALLRIGLMEMVDFIDIFFKGAQLRTFFESCGIADLVTTCQGGRNRKLGEHLAKSKQSISEIEKEVLNGQSFQGPLTAKEVYLVLKERDMLDRCPLFVAVHHICQREIEPNKIIDAIKNHPLHSMDPSNF